MVRPVLGVRRRGTVRSAEPADSEAGPWQTTAVARVLSVLCRRPVSDEEVRDRAVGLGLHRLSTSREPAPLSAMAVCRLFLAGYRLPAAAELAGIGTLPEHHRAGRRLFVTLAEQTNGERRPNGSDVHEVRGFLGTGEQTVLLAQAGTAAVDPWQLALTSFAASWSAAGSLLILAAGGWKDLPADGPTFFAGYRNPDGSYHWNTAECDTDRAGEILRY